MDLGPRALASMAVLLFVIAIVLGNLEPVMTDMKTSETSTKFNTTVDNIASYTWTGMQLLIIGILILAAVAIMRYVGYL